MATLEQVLDEAGRLHGPLTDGMRDALVRKYGAARRSGEEERAACLALAEYLAVQREGDRPRARASEAEEVSERESESAPAMRAGSEGERAHAEAVRARVERIGNLDPAVLEFRASLGVPARGLSKRDALALLRSPRLASVSRESLDAAGRKAVEDSRRGSEDGVALPVSRPLPGARLLPLEFPNERGEREAARVLPGSVLGEVRRRGEYLARRHPFSVLRLSPVGAETGCIWFLLTGRVLPLAPITRTLEMPGSFDVVTVAALARVASPQSVAAAFGAAQRSLLGQRKGRPPAERTLAALAFVERAVGGPARKLPPAVWRKQFEAWNKRHKREAFSEPKDLRKACESALGGFFPDRETWKSEAPALVRAAFGRWAASGRTRRVRRKVQS